MSEKPAAAPPLEEAPRCLVCDRDLVACRLFTDEAKATCYQRGYERSTAAHQKTLDAQEAALLASRTKLRQQQGVKAAFSGLAASAASILAAEGRNV